MFQSIERYVGPSTDISIFTTRSTFDDTATAVETTPAGILGAKDNDSRDDLQRAYERAMNACPSDAVFRNSNPFRAYQDAGKALGLIIRYPVGVSVVEVKPPCRPIRSFR